MAYHQQEEQEEQYPLVYNMWFNGPVEIHANEVIFQTGKPTDPPPSDGSIDESIGEG